MSINNFVQYKKLYKSRVLDSEEGKFANEPYRDRLGTYKIFRGPGPPVIVKVINK